MYGKYMNEIKVFKEFINFYKYDIIKICLLISNDYINNSRHFKHNLIKLLISKEFLIYIYRIRKVKIEDILDLHLLATMLFDYFESLCD
jgi:hypothetical protein